MDGTRKPMVTMISVKLVTTVLVDPVLLARMFGGLNFSQSFYSSRGQSACQECSSPNVTGDLQNSCTPCPANAIPSSNGKTCVVCGTGFYANEFECSRCIPAHYCVTGYLQGCPSGMLCWYHI